MNTKKNTGRSFLGTLFLIALGFVIGFYNAEIFAFSKDAIHNIRNR
jgi:hypothetical protein